MSRLCCMRHALSSYARAQPILRVLYFAQLSALPMPWQVCSHRCQPCSAGSSMISLNLRHAAQRLARASATLQCSGIGSRHSGRGAAWLQQCARPRRDAFKVNGTRLAQLHRSGPRTTSSSPPTTPSSLVQRRFARCPARARPILVCSVKVRVGISKAHLNGQLEGKPIEKAGPTGQ